MKVALLTMFNGLSNAYSLVSVAREQLLMLLGHDIFVKMLVSEHCPDSDRTGIFADPRIDWIKIVNSKDGEPFHWENYTQKNLPPDDSFMESVDCIAADFEKALADTDICILHDILYQELHLLHNAAIRKVQKKLPHIRFLAFTHSAPVPHQDAPYPASCLYTSMPNTLYCYPTQCGLQYLKQQYAIPETLCRHVSNSLDVLQGMTEETKTIDQLFPLTKSDILIVYPARLAMAKGFHLVAQLAGTIKTVSGKSVSLIFCDFPASDICPCIYKPIVFDTGEKAGLAKEDIFFTTDHGFPLGVQRETVYDLFSLSNLFICPSFSESFGLTVLEAASRGNFLVLNDAVEALHELGTSLNAYPMRWAARNFDKVSFEHYQPSESEYFKEQAEQIVLAMDENPIIRAKTLARTRYSTEWIYEHQLKSCFHNPFIN